MEKFLPRQQTNYYCLARRKSTFAIWVTAKGFIFPNMFYCRPRKLAKFTRPKGGRWEGVRWDFLGSENGTKSVWGWCADQPWVCVYFRIDFHLKNRFHLVSTLMFRKKIVESTPLSGLVLQWFWGEMRYVNWLRRRRRRHDRKNVKLMPN